MPQLQHTIDTVLTRVKTAAQHVGVSHTRAYSSDAPLCRIVSSLAEGSDRIVAVQGIHAGYELQCPLPFPTAEYENDFTDERSTNEFRALLSRATARLELDGTRNDADLAYEQAGRVMLAQSDLLIAIWDGAAERGRGGTAQMVAEARTAGMPVVWVHSRTPHACRLLTRRADGPKEVACSDDALSSEVERLLMPEIESNARLERAYFDGTSGHRRPLGLFAQFRKWVLRWEPQGSEGTLEPLPKSSEALQHEYGWADDLANLYGAYYRDSFVANYVLGALAVLMGLIGYRWYAAVLVELVLLIAIVGVTKLGQRECWHNRWLNFRFLAEQLRQAEVLWPVGRVLPSFRVPPHATTDDPSRLWVSWLARARIRALGMVDAVVTPDYSDRYRRALESRLRDQIGYHQINARRSRALAHRLHAIGTWLFVSAAAACVLHLLVDLVEPWHPTVTQGGSRAPVLLAPAAVLTLLAAFLPALGAALAAISTQGEFSRLADRSSAMVPRLSALQTQLQATASSSASSAHVAEEAIEMMTGELLDWQITFRAKPLDFPT